MRSCRIIAAAVLALALSACQGGKATVDCTVAEAPSASLTVRQLNGTTPVVLDTVKTDAAGRFSYKVKVEKGNPEFIYVYKGSIHSGQYIFNLAFIYRSHNLLVSFYIYFCKVSVFNYCHSCFSVTLVYNNIFYQRNLSFSINDFKWLLTNPLA